MRLPQFSGFPLPAAFRTPLAPLLLSDALMVLAVMVGHVAVPWWIAQQGGAADLARYGVVMSLVGLAAVPLLSPLGDRHAKRTLLMTGMACAAVAASLLAWWTGTQAYLLGAVMAIQAVPVLAFAAIGTASNSLMAELVPATQLSRAISWQQSAQSGGRMLGPALGGAALAAAGTSFTLWLHAGLLAVSALMAARLPVPARPAAPTRPDWWREMRAGLRANWAIPLERGWMASNFLAWLFLFPAFTLLVPLKVQSLGLSGLWLGLCEAALSLGILIGMMGGAAPLIARHGRFRSRIMSAVLQGLALAFAGWTSQPLLLVAAFALVGFTNAVVTLVGLTHRTLARPLAFRSRMSAGSVMTVQVAATLGPAVAGIALAHWPVSAVYTCFGVLGGLASLSLAWVPGFKAFMALEHAEVEGWYGRMHPQVFAPASAAAPASANEPGGRAE